MSRAIDTAVRFIITHEKCMNKDINTEEMTRFRRNLTHEMTRHYSNNWPGADNWQQGSSRRCLNVERFNTDPLLLQAAKLSGMTMQELKKMLPPNEMRVFVDPGLVAYQHTEEKKRDDIDVTPIYYPDQNPSKMATAC